jgi:hypothetical protein
VGVTADLPSPAVARRETFAVLAHPVLYRCAGRQAHVAADIDQRAAARQSVEDPIGKLGRIGGPAPPHDCPPAGVQPSMVVPVGAGYGRALMGDFAICNIMGGYLRSSRHSGARSCASHDAQLRIRESILPVVVMDSRLMQETGAVKQGLDFLSTGGG